MDSTRRTMLGGGMALLVACEAAVPADVELDPIPPLPPAVPPGRPGDFDFLTGEWRIHHRRLRAPDTWDEFEGTATVHALLGGIGSVEELRIPARDFAGMGLRLLDVEKRIWSDFWVNAKSGALATPGQTGGFVDGVGIFSTADVENGRAVVYVGVWDRIAAASCRWRQAKSYDAGRTWQQDWIMRWTRVGGTPGVAHEGTSSRA